LPHEAKIRWWKADVPQHSIVKIISRMAKGRSDPPTTRIERRTGLPSSRAAPRVSLQSIVPNPVPTKADAFRPARTACADRPRLQARSRGTSALLPAHVRPPILRNEAVPIIR
jgi:hypothetical protein